MDLYDFFGKKVNIVVNNGLKVSGKVEGFYSSIETNSGKDEIDILPIGWNHYLSLTADDIVKIEII